MTILSVLTFLSGPDVEPWVDGALIVLRMTTAAISFLVAVHRGIRYLRRCRRGKP